MDGFRLRGRLRSVNPRRQKAVKTYVPSLTPTPPQQCFSEAERPSTMASSANHVHYGAVWPALLLRARQKVSLGSLAGPQSSAADQTHGGEINHLTVQAAAAAEQRQQSVQQLLCFCQLPLAVPLAGRAATSRVDGRSSRRPAWTWELSTDSSQSRPLVTATDWSEAERVAFPLHSYL